MGDCQARFCERLGLKCPCLLDQGKSALEGAREEVCARGESIVRDL
jgi:hypothetical protein